MASLALALAHPAAPVAWWAIHSPAVQEAVLNALAATGDSADPRRLEEHGWSPRDYWAGLAIAFLATVAFWLIAATVYKSSVADVRPLFPESMEPELSLGGGTDFKYGLFACCSDCQYCVHSFCCLPLRAGDTYQAVGASGYWCVVFAFLLVWLGAELFGEVATWALLQTDVLAASEGRLEDDVALFSLRFRLQDAAGKVAYIISYGVLAMWLALQRRKLRERLGDSQPRGKFCYDCLTYWCCSCCNAIQEARQVDEIEGVRVECCCSLGKVVLPVGVAIEAPVVGNVVAVGQVVG